MYGLIVDQLSTKERTSDLYSVRMCALLVQIASIRKKKGLPGMAVASWAMK